MRGYGMRRTGDDLDVMHGMGFGRFAGPHGPGHARVGRRGGPFAQGRRGHHHLIPTLLILLRKGPQHGYALLGELGDVLPRPGAMPDVSSVYRALGELEEVGAVASRWEAGDGGGRRVYELTPAGEEMLKSWVPHLEEEHRRLGRLIARYHA